MATHDTTPGAVRAPRAASPGVYAAGVVLLLFIVLGVPALVLPAGRDQAIFALVGSIISGGGMPYVDAFDFKPPGVHLIYALAAIGGDVMAGAHALELLGLAVSAWALYRLVAPEGRLAAGIASAHLVAAYLGTLRYWDLAQPEGFAIPFVLTSLLLFRQGRARSRVHLAAGALLGIAALLKYPTVLFGLLFPLLGAPAHPVTGPERIVDIEPIGEGRRRAYAWTAAGFALPMVITLLWLTAGGALGAFLSIQTDYVPGYTRLTTIDGISRAAEASWAITRAFYGDRPLLLWPPLLGLLTVLVARPTARAYVPVLGAFLATAGVVAQGKFFHYHWVPILPFLAWLSGLAASRLAAALARPREVRTAVGLLIVLYAVAFALSFRTVSAEKVAAIERVTGMRDRDAFRGSPAFGTMGVGDHALLATTRVTEEISRIAQKGDRLFVWGFEPLIYLESGLAPASRFIYTAAFISPWCPREWSEELVRDLTRDPPEIVVVASQDAIPWVTGVPLDSRGALREYPAIVELLRTRYTLAGQIERFTLFTRAFPSDAGARAAP